MPGVWRNVGKLPAELLMISNTSSHIQHSHILPSLLNMNLITPDSAEWTEMLEIGICSHYRSSILLPGFIINNGLLNFINVSISQFSFSRHLIVSL